MAWWPFLFVSEGGEGGEGDEGDEEEVDEDDEWLLLLVIPELLVVADVVVTVGIDVVVDERVDEDDAKENANCEIAMMEANTKSEYNKMNH